MSLPWCPVLPLPEAQFRPLQRRAIFDCCKWDPQVGDVDILAPLPLLIRQSAWQEVVTLAEGLARETLEAEHLLLSHPDLHPKLGLPRPVLAALKAAAKDASAGVARLVRFDFHYTDSGWRISEANSDVPGGLNEASGLAKLFAPHYPQSLPTGDPAGAYVEALLEQPQDKHLALVHATAYSDDRQVMMYLAERLQERGARASLVSPSQLVWREGQAGLAGENRPLDAIVRFFPGEWLPNLPRRSGWQHFFAGSRTPLSNPATALLTQSKRFPLVWEGLEHPLKTWRALLPETRDPHEVPWQRGEDWVLKPALGRVGEDVALPGVTEKNVWAKLAREVKGQPQDWLAQRPFHTLPLCAGGTRYYPCLGVYTVGSHVVGAYGRLARRPLTDAHALDAAVLVMPDHSPLLETS